MRQFLMIAVLSTACSGQDADDVIGARQLPPAIRADAAATAAANNQFAFELYSQLPATGNIVLSPFSISTAMAMVDAGAAGATDQELRTALHFALPGERTHAAYGALLASLQVGRDHGAYTLSTANRLFGQQGFAFLPSYLSITQRDYGASLMPVDFRGDAEGARGAVNAWVAEQTEHKIAELFKAGELESSTVLALANAIVFKGTWAQKFDRALTSDEAFTLADGSVVQTPTMHTSAVIRVTGFSGARVGVLPFGGKDLSMVIVLPSVASGLAAVEATLAGVGLPALIDGVTGTGASGIAREPSELALPKFSVTARFELKPALAALGITSPFDEATADFSAIDGQRGLVLRRVVHQAVIAVDEDGAEAAAATGAGFNYSAAPAPFVVDRPFVFLIYDHVTSSILFLGRMTDPRS